jgi:hypothetical protein
MNKKECCQCAGQMLDQCVYTTKHVIRGRTLAAVTQGISIGLGKTVLNAVVHWLQHHAFILERFAAQTLHKAVG